MSSSGTNPKIAIDAKASTKGRGDSANEASEPKEPKALGTRPDLSSAAHDTVKSERHTWQPPKATQDTVKLSHQTWKPPPEAPETVKLTHQTWRPPRKPPDTEPDKPLYQEDADTDIRGVPLPPSSLPTSNALSSEGEADAEVAGEIGTDHEEPVRIVSIPPPAVANVRERAPLPGLIPAAAAIPRAVPPERSRPTSTSKVTTPVSAASSPNTTTARSPAVPIPIPVPPAPMRAVEPTPVPRALAPAPMAPPVAEQPPSFALRDESAPFARRDESAPFNRGDGSAPFGRQEPTPLPTADSRRFAAPAGKGSPLAVGESTMMINIGRGPTKLIIITATIASLLGLGAGYMLWGYPNRDAGKNEAVQTSAESPAGGSATTEDVTPQPALAPVKATCVLEVSSTPTKASVSLDGKSLGVTPFRGELPCKSAGELAVSHKRYSTDKRALALDADEKIEVTLERPVFEMVIDSNPKGATLHINDKEVGKTPHTVDMPGFVTARIKVVHDGYRPTVTRLTPKRARTATYKLRRERKRRRRR